VQVLERRSRAARECGKRAFFLKAAASNIGRLPYQVEWVSKGGFEGETGLISRIRIASRTPMSIK
jgi:hypothetical protein